MSSPSGKMPRTSLDRFKSCCHGALFISLTADTPRLTACVCRWFLQQTVVSISVFLAPRTVSGACSSVWQHRLRTERSPRSVTWQGDQCYGELATGCTDAWIRKRYVERGWNQSHCTELRQSHVHLFNKSVLPLPILTVIDMWMSPGPAPSKGKSSVQRMCLNPGKWIKDSYSIVSLFFFTFYWIKHMYGKLRKS